jgi:hypothetical protein
VVLTFVTNDIGDMLGRTLPQILSFDELDRPESASRAFVRTLLTRTAIGEGSLAAYLSLRSPPFRAARERMRHTRDGDGRYAIAGGADYDANVAHFLKRNAGGDGLVLRDELDARTTSALTVYGEALGAFAALCRQHGARPVFVYFPAYSQVYDPAASRRVNATLAAQCAKHGITFVDLTDGFARAGRSGVFHLAPLDYHLNPAGHRLFADLLAQPLIDLAATKAPAPPVP